MNFRGLKKDPRAILAALAFLAFPAGGLPAQPVERRVPDMAFVRGGTFTMGDTLGEGFKFEKPTRRVTLSSFYIGRTEVTQREFRNLMGFNPSVFKGDSLPVENVTWYDAAAFCNEKSRREGLPEFYAMSGIRKNWVGNITAAKVNADWTGKGYRLPTEAEWEFAARGGIRSRGYRYSGGDDPAAAAWHGENSVKTTQTAGVKGGNELGIYDMSGNVWEWCWDFWRVYGEEEETDPRGPEAGEYRMLRGGSWRHEARFVRITVRYDGSMDNRDSDIGFRIARN